MENKKISDLIPDDKNFNKGSEFGNSLIEKSFRKFGAGRSILLDKNNKIIAGNKSVENAFSIGIEDVQIIESDGKRIIAVKRTDIDLDSPEGREMALADNASAKANIVFEAELIEAEFNEASINEWGIETSKQANKQKQELKPYNKHHVLISYPLHFHSKIIEYIDKISQIDSEIEIETGSN